MEAHKYNEAGFLPEVWDKQRNCPASILDQTEFFHTMSQVVAVMKSRAEAKIHDIHNKGK